MVALWQTSLIASVSVPALKLNLANLLAGLFNTTHVYYAVSIIIAWFATEIKSLNLWSKWESSEKKSRELRLVILSMTEMAAASYDGTNQTSMAQMMLQGWDLMIYRGWALKRKQMWARKDSVKTHTRSSRSVSPLDCSCGKHSIIIFLYPCSPPGAVQQCWSISQRALFRQQGNTPDCSAVRLQS